VKLNPERVGLKALRGDLKDAAKLKNGSIEDPRPALGRPASPALS
jgi:hypothetical protein